MSNSASGKDVRPLEVVESFRQPSRSPEHTASHSPPNCFQPRSFYFSPSHQVSLGYGTFIDSEAPKNHSDQSLYLATTKHNNINNNKVELVAACLTTAISTADNLNTDSSPTSQHIWLAGARALGGADAGPLTLGQLPMVWALHC